MVKAGFRNSYMLLLFVFFSFLLNETVIIGNDYIADATDQMLSGVPIQLSGLIIPFLCMIAFGTLSAYLKGIFGRRYSAAVQRDVRVSLEQHLLKLPFSYFDKKGTGSIITRLISDIEAMGKFFSEILPNLLVNLITVLTATVYLIHMDAMLIIVLFTSYPVMLIAADKLSKKLAELAAKLRTHMDERTEKAYDAVQGIVVGRSYNLYELHRNKINTVIDNMTAQSCKSTRISSLGWVLKNVITTIPVIFCYLFALYEILQGKITVGELLAFTVILNRILNPIGDIVFCANDIRETGVSLRRLQEIYDQPGERTEGNVYPVPGQTEPVPAIVWNNVAFRYENNSGRPVLDGVSFSVEAGRQIAFVGGSGEGKTTIFKLLCGFYEKSSGQYTLFGHSYEDWSLEAARSCFSIVSQNVFLFPESIRQNVACGRENAADAEIVEACQNANIHDFILSLPEGYETLVGERGVRLSGGQRQRISIARAFLKNAPILLLDEPTASVDIEAEQNIQEAVEKITSGKTVITIAHRLSTVKNADRIYVVNGGRIAETGSHEELMEEHGIYAELYAKG